MAQIKHGDVLLMVSMNLHKAINQNMELLISLRFNLRHLQLTEAGAN